MGWKGKGVQELILSLFSVSSHSLRSFVSPPFHSIPLISVSGTWRLGMKMNGDEVAGRTNPRKLQSSLYYLSLLSSLRSRLIHR